MTSVKRIIGLTGNIATGKSVVRRMLVNHGALGIDADVITHRVLYPGGTAYQAVVDSFGEQILTPTGEIERGRLAEIVFTSPDQLRQLEQLIHPAVTIAIQQRIEAATLPLIVIEAIKLMESSLAGLIDSLWVSHVPEEEQLARLINTRKMAADDARQRIAVQPPQTEKLSHADVVIYTEGTFENTWRQIHAALNDTIQLNNALETLNINIVNNWWILPVGYLPSSQLEAFIEEHLNEQHEDLYNWLAFKVLTPVMNEQGMEQLVVWSCSNFTGKLEQILMTAPTPEQKESALLAFEAHARANQCELLIVPGDIADKLDNSLPQNGFKRVQAGRVAYLGWKQAIITERAPWIKVLSQPLESTNKTFYD